MPEKRKPTVAEQLAAAERCLEDFRWARNRPDLPEGETYESMRAIAADLQARQPAASGKVLASLQRRLADAAAAKTGQGGLGFEPSALIGIGQEVIGSWPVIRQALERFEAASREPGK